jgi:hypothetical protein
MLGLTAEISEGDAVLFRLDRGGFSRPERKVVLENVEGWKTRRRVELSFKAEIINNSGSR